VKAILERLLVVSMLLAWGQSEVRAQDIDLAILTVPSSRLFPGCVLSPPPWISTGQLRGGFGRLPRNPRKGVDRPLVADIRETVAASPFVPDGPPLSRTELTRFHLQLAEDVEEAYAAVYTDTDAHLVTVHGVRFVDTPVPEPPRGKLDPSRGVRMVRGRTVVAVLGDGGACFKAVAAYVGEITVR
jgi:hypothetical protein